MASQGSDRDVYRAETAEVVDLALQYLRSRSDLFVPTSEVARAIGVNPNRLGYALRRTRTTFQLERTYVGGSLATVVALRPGSRSSSSSNQ